MPKRIPISAARKFSKEHDLRQIIIAAWDGEDVHIVTYGKTINDCAQAAQGGNELKKALGWPKTMWHAWPSRVRKLQDRIKELEAQLDRQHVSCGAEDINPLTGETD